MGLNWKSVCLQNDVVDLIGCEIAKKLVVLIQIYAVAMDDCQLRRNDGRVFIHMSSHAARACTNALIMSRDLAA
jgi:hypothetical protein